MKNSILQSGFHAQTAGISTSMTEISQELKDSQESSHFQVKLEEFEGPLDLLLAMIRKQKIDILDIPIAHITEQFLEGLHRAESLDFDVDAEFILMAATLIHMKSKMLLPKSPLAIEENEPDPRADLVKKLLERERYTQAAQMLKQKRVVEEHVWTAQSVVSLMQDDNTPTEMQVSLFDLAKTYDEVIERLQSQPVMELEHEHVSVASRIRYLKNLLVIEDAPLSIRDIFLRQGTPRAVLATFLAVLELVKAHAIELHQKELFGEIVIRRHKLFDEAFRNGELLPASDSELEYSF